MTFEKAGRPVDITQMDLEEGPINRPSVGAVIPAGLARSLQPFICNVVFASVDQDHISWAAGTVTFADGGTQAIALNASQVLTATHYLYFDLNHASPTVLKISTTYSDCVGEGKGLIAVAKIGSAGQKAYVQNLALTNIFINADSMLANCVTEPAILASAVTAVKISVATLDAISANVGTLTSGTINGVTIYAGSSAVVLDANGATIHGAFLIFHETGGGANATGYVYLANGSDLAASQDTLGDLLIYPPTGVTWLRGTVPSLKPEVTNVGYLGDASYWFSHLYCLRAQLAYVWLWEVSAAEASIAGRSQLWTKNTNPTELWFTDDAGTSTKII